MATPFGQKGSDHVKRLAVIDNEKCIGCQSCMFACARKGGQGGLADSRIQIRSAGGIERGFVVVVCRACRLPGCASVCPTDALTRRDDGGVDLDSTKCVGCKLCVQACPMGAVLWNREIKKPMICVRCGVCVKHCPYGVLALEENREV